MSLLSSEAEAGYHRHHGHHHRHYGHHQHHGYSHRGRHHRHHGHRHHPGHVRHEATGAIEAPSLGGQTGLATWYGPGFYGRRTASGERFTGGGLTAAHRSLPFGTRVQVVNETTGRSVVVRINDRGPYRHGAVIDLSRASAQALGITGSARVRLARLGG